MTNRFRPSVARVLFAVSLFFAGLPSTFALTIDTPLPTSHNVTIQPIILSDNDGSNTAEFFGSAAQQSIIEGLINQIWAQAGIAVNFLAANTWNNTFANEGSNPPNTRPTSDLNTIRTTGTAAGVTNADPTVINMFFVNIPAGFNQRSENSAAGLAFVDGNGVTQYVGSNLLSFSGGQEVIAKVVAHEIGHNLGLFHAANGGANLMSPGGTTEQLTSAQIAIVLDSNLSIAVAAVPVPAAFWLFGSAIFMLFRVKKSRPVQLVASAA